MGDGELKQSLETRVCELGLVGKVHFLGLCSDVSQILAAGDIFVLASHSEGHPLALMEAMSAGLPAVATAVGGVPDLLENQVEGLLVRSGDCEGMASAMVRLLEDSSERLGMARAAKQRAEQHFSASQMTKTYIQLYEDVLTKRTSLLRSGQMVVAHPDQ